MNKMATGGHTIHGMESGERENDTERKVRSWWGRAYCVCLDKGCSKQRPVQCTKIQRQKSLGSSWNAKCQEVRSELVGSLTMWAALGHGKG